MVHCQFVDHLIKRLDLQYNAGHSTATCRHNFLKSPTIINKSDLAVRVNHFCVGLSDSALLFDTRHKGPSIKYVTLFLMIFDPLLCHILSQILDPLKVCHTSVQKVNKQISRRMETALNNYNRYYYILNNNKIS